jgi:D-alanyl-lipoteichoic acid acyltransferase DltB (MBOAT superfamily)
MSITVVLIAAILAGVLGILARGRWRMPLLLVVSALAVYALQPKLPIRYLDFWLPTLTLALAALSWVLTTPRAQRVWKDNWLAVTILVGVSLAMGLTRYLNISLPIPVSRPPAVQSLLLVEGIVLVLALLLARFTLPGPAALKTSIVLLILALVAMKIPSVAQQISIALRSLSGQSTAAVVVLDFRWLGFSYIVFRLLHTLFDRLSGRLPVVSMGEYVVYVVFFPALAAGPIDRIERFISDLRAPFALTFGDTGEAGRRLLIGMFKKFVIADTLALIALNGNNALQVNSAGWAWVMLYAYAFQIYFDFSGYTDIAIGLGRLMGIKLPENFKSPYLKPNITQFWNSWHMTLTQWFRAYYFNPVTRTLRSAKKPLSIPVIIFFTQLSTMILIGMWHGITWNFFLWGLWHGLGLFAQNRWSERMKVRSAGLTSRWQSALNAGGVFLTFNFVALGWVFFALPAPSSSLQFMKTLFGLG